MAQSTDHIARTLNHLITTVRDREAGYRTGAQGVRSPELKSLFDVYAEQSAQFSTALQHEVERLGQPATHDASLAGAAFRGWIQIKSAVTGGSEGAVLVECERGEDVAVGAYERALQELPPELQPVVVRQYTELKSAHHRIRTLRDAVANAGGA